MAVAITKTVLVNGSTAGSGSVFAENTDTFHLHRFFCTLQSGTAATLLVQGSYDGSNWCTFGSAITNAGTTCVEVDRAWSNLRVSWTGNNSKTVLVQLAQMYSDPLGAI